MEAKSKNALPAFGNPKPGPGLSLCQAAARSRKVGAFLPLLSRLTHC